MTRFPRYAARAVGVVVAAGLGVALAATAIASSPTATPSTGATTTTPTTTTTTPTTTTIPVTPPPPTIPAGVRIGVVPVSGLTAEQAVSAVMAAYTGGHLTIRVASRTYQPRRSYFSVRFYALRSAVSKALNAHGPTTFRLRLGYATARAAGVAAAWSGRATVQPQSAAWGFRNMDAVLVPDTNGISVPSANIAAAIAIEIHNPYRRLVTTATTTLRPSVSAASLGPAIVISRSDHQLRYFTVQGRRGVLDRIFQVATGRPQYPTPAGLWTIVVKQRDPWWYPPPAPWAAGLKPIPPGPGNPLGTRWMGLSASGVGIHGTPDAASVGYSASHGCIRMHIPDAEWLFDHVQIGNPVRIV